MQEGGGFVPSDSEYGSEDNHNYHDYDHDYDCSDYDRDPAVDDFTEENLGGSPHRDGNGCDKDTSGIGQKIAAVAGGETGERPSDEVEAGVPAGSSSSGAKEQVRTTTATTAAPMATATTTPATTTTKTTTTTEKTATDATATKATTTDTIATTTTAMTTTEKTTTDKTTTDTTTTATTTTKRRKKKKSRPGIVEQLKARESCSEVDGAAERGEQRGGAGDDSAAPPMSLVDAVAAMILGERLLRWLW